MDEENPWSVLDIKEQNADERSVKRAYAKKLKTCRPDDDAEGFQKLLKARDLALWQVKNSSFSALSNMTPAAVGDRPKRASEIHDFSHSFFEEKLEEMGRWDFNIWDLPYWQRLFNSLNESDYCYRQDIEWLLIRQVGSRITDQYDDFSSEDKKQEALRVLSFLSDEFGWNEDDKKLYRVLGHRDADLLLSLIRTEMYDRQSHIGIRGGIPFIAISDLRAFTGVKGEDVVQYYLSAWQSGKWDSRSNWSGFPLGYVWRAWPSFWLLVVLAVIFQVCVLLLLNAKDMLSSVIWEFLLMSVMLLPFMLIARYGRYLVIRSAVKVIDKAKNKNFSSLAARHYFLQKKGQGSYLFALALLVLEFSLIFMLFSV